MGAARIAHRENARLQPAPTAPTRRRCAPQRGSTPVGRSAAAPRKYCSVPKCTGAGRSRRGACARPASGAGPKRPLRAGRARGRRWPGPVFRARSVAVLAPRSVCCCEHSALAERFKRRALPSAKHWPAAENKQQQTQQQKQKQEPGGTQCAMERGRTKAKATAKATARSRSLPLVAAGLPPGRGRLRCVFS